MDASGFLVESYDYDPYGARELRNGNGVLVCSTSAAQACGSSYGNTQGYAGRFLSAFSGLYDMRARSYSPYLRQFLSPDPLGYGGGGFDLWSYANGDPVNLWDTWGLAAGPTTRAPAVIGASQLDFGLTQRGGGWTQSTLFSGPTIDVSSLGEALHDMRELAAYKNTAGVGGRIKASRKMGVDALKKGDLADARKHFNEAKAILSEKGISYTSYAPCSDCVVLLHGTNGDGRRSIESSGIDVSKSSNADDYGVGFYMAVELEVAVSSAVRKKGGTEILWAQVSWSALGQVLDLSDETQARKDWDAWLATPMSVSGTKGKLYEQNMYPRGDCFNDWLQQSGTTSVDTVFGPLYPGPVSGGNGK